MKNAVYVLWYANRHLSTEALLNGEKVKPVALAIVELCLTEGIRQSVSQY